MWKIQKKMIRIWNDNLIRLDIWWDIIFDYIPDQEILDRQMLEEIKEDRSFTIRSRTPDLDLWMVSEAIAKGKWEGEDK